MRGQYTEAAATAQKRYSEKNVVYIGMRLNRNNDAEVIAKLESVQSRQKYINNLIRADLGLPPKEPITRKTGAFPEDT